MKKKIALMVISLVLVVAMAVGGTLAWLNDKSEIVQNTFTMGNISIKLDETNLKTGDRAEEGNTYKVAPGTVVTKDPLVTVNAGSEACYLFVKVEKSDGFDNFAEYKIAEGWTELTAGSGIYWREVGEIAATASPAEFTVLKDNKVTIKDTLTEMADITMTFTAYAIQKDNIASAEAAWDELT